MTDKAPLISPSVGRVVWFHPAPTKEPAPTLAAIIAAVNPDGSINLMVISAGGDPHGERNVFLWAGDDDAKRPVGAYAEWMPYQKSVARGDIPATKHAT